MCPEFIKELDFTPLRGQKYNFDDTADGYDEAPRKTENPKEGARSISEELASCRLSQNIQICMYRR